MKAIDDGASYAGYCQLIGDKWDMTKEMSGNNNECLKRWQGVNMGNGNITMGE